MRGAWLSLLLLLPASAAASGYADLGKLEREAVDDALALRGLTLDPEPQGKIVATVRVVNLDVFLARERVPLVWANIFHRTTREHQIRRESLLQAADRYDQDLAEETTRKLQDRTLSSVVAVLPVKSATPGMVDVLIVTRDVWSLRLNENFEAQQNQLIYFTASLSENNFFGWRKFVAAVFTMDQGEMSFGPNYIDPNILGTRLQLQAAFYWIWARQIGEIAAGPQEGTTSHFRLEYPLWALARRWGAYSDFRHFDGVIRRFLGTELRQIPLDGLPRNACDPLPSVAPDVPTVPWVYRLKTINTSEVVTRSFPRPAVIQRVSVGHELALVRPSFTSDFPYAQGSPEREQFSQEVFPLSERVSDLFLSYELFTPRYRVFRDLNTFDFRENVRFGPYLSLKAGRTFSWVGSQSDFSLFQTSVGLTKGAMGGLQSVGGTWEGRVVGGEVTDQLVRGRAILATPVLAGLLRVVAAGNLGLLFRNTRKRFFAVGGDTGPGGNESIPGDYQVDGDSGLRAYDSVLRGYPVGEFVGCGAQFVGHIEARSMALKLAFLRLGGLLFFDAGHAAADASRLAFYSDAGFGLRLLIPQLDTYSLRADWAFPLRPAPGMPAGWPGRMTFGFRQVF
jgi:hypothetical protein